ncbi:MAG: GNAT family N-acetyltransferase [Pseudomonadota bacterium]
MALSDDYGLRAFQPGDEQWLSQITLSAICAVGARHYSPEQIEAWSAGHKDAARIAKRAEEGAYIVVGIAGIALPAAYALLERDEAGDGHLDMLYCHPDHTRKGLAEALLADCEKQAHDWQCPRLYTEASELAKAAFERAGYAVTNRRDFTIEGPGGAVPIHNYAMEKTLS